MKTLATLVLALFCASAIPAAVPAPHLAPQIKNYNNGKKPHKVKHHRGRKHRRA